MRLATASDIPRIVQMVTRLAASVGVPQVVDPEWTGASLAALIASPDASVWVTDGGFLAAQLVRTTISPELVAVEHGWWAEDRSGLRLLRAYERWARERGATRIRLSTGINGPDLSRLGYRPAEQAWVK